MKDILKKRKWERNRIAKKQAERELIKVVCLDGEFWLDVPDFIGFYKVSNLARIKSISRWCVHSKNSKKLLSERLITPSKPTNKKKYITISLSKNGETYYKLLHRLVAMAFIPNPENKPEVNHLDGDPSNCNVSNLEWATKSENQIHSIRVLGNKTSGRGELNKNCKLTFANVGEIRDRYKSGKYTHRSLAAIYQVSSARVTNIINNKARIND